MVKKRFTGKSLSAWQSWEMEAKRKPRPGKFNSRRRNVVSVKDAIKNWASQGTIKKRLNEVDLIENWSDFVGSSLASQSTPIKFEKGNLVIKVVDSTWRHQLLFMRRELIGKINGKLKSSAVKTITFTG